MEAEQRRTADEVRCAPHPACFVMLLRAHLLSYRCAGNLTVAYNFGYLLGVTYILQIFSGLWLATRYSADEHTAFHSVHIIQREAPYGWLVRTLHGTGSSAVFICLICHMLRSTYFRSFVYLRLTWLSGLGLYAATIVTAFLGYVLPWGLMSYWGATVIVNLLAVVPYVVPWILGGWYAMHITIRRFYVLHFVIPLIACLGIGIHVFYLHLQGSSNPLGGSTSLRISFGPSLVASDMRTGFVAMAILLMQIGLAVIQFSHPDNAIPVNRLVTPLHIVPEWYFLALYGTLKCIPSKVAGVLALALNIVMLVLYAGSRRITIRLRTKVVCNWRNMLVPTAVIMQLLSILMSNVGRLAPHNRVLIYGRGVLIAMYLVGILVTR